MKLQHLKKFRIKSNICASKMCLMLGIIIHWLIFPDFCLAQSTDPLISTISLRDLSAFKNAPKKWRIVGNVHCGPYEKEISKEEKGTGILLNKPTNNIKGDLVTNFNHGDIDLEFDFLLPNGSSSAVYLQSRYGIKLTDSWSQANSVIRASGAIIQVSKDYKQEVLLSPRINACRAPGLWQNMKISFQAPKFDNNGKKVSNAKFLKVTYNDVVIHENVDVAGVTYQNVSGNENSLGPIVFSGDDEIAIKNIKYKISGNKKVEINNVSYNYYEGNFNKVADFSSVSPTKSNTTKEITWKLAENETRFALKFTGELLIPVSGTYNFQIQTPGISSFIVDNKTLIDLAGIHSRKKSDKESGSIELEKGLHSFTVVYIKNIPFGTPQLGLYVEGPEIRKHPLHAPSSLPVGFEENPISVEPGNSTIVQRCFIENNLKKQTFCVAVGQPGNIHYAMDLSQGALIGFWKGKFIDATTMWTGRGDEQLAKPLGSGINLPWRPMLAILKSKDDSWPDSIHQAGNYKFKGYQLDEQGRPTFKYLFNDAVIEDKITPEKNQYLSRTVNVKFDKNKDTIWIRLAEGSGIELLEKGLYVVNDKSYYIQMNENEGQKPLIRKTKNGEELVFPITDKQDQLRYSLIW